MIRRAFTCQDRSGAQFVYVAPEKQQAKEIAWSKFKYYCENIPGVHIREDELTITFPDNNATICLEGASNTDRLRGRHFHFVAMDEVGQMNRDVWYETIFPATMTHSAPVLFIGTPKGDNLFKELYDGAVESVKHNDPNWFHALVDVYKSGIYNNEEIELMRRTQPKEKFEQEYLCSFDVIFDGSFYGNLLTDRNIGDYHWDPMLPVITGWDLGTADKTAIWFAQQKEGKVYLIDYYENNNRDIYHYINFIKSKPYRYDYHVLPHDAANRNWETHRSRVGVLRSMGLATQLCPRMRVDEAISLTQAQLHKCRFDKKNCALGIRHLSSYRSKTDPVTGKETGVPRHDMTSDCADAFRTLILGMKPEHKSYSPNWWEGDNRDMTRYSSHDVFNYFY